MKSRDSGDIRDIKGSREKLDSLDNSKRRGRDPHGKPINSHIRDPQQIQKSDRHANNRHHRDRIPSNSSSKDRRSPITADIYDGRGERSPNLPKHHIKVEQPSDSPSGMEDTRESDKFRDKQHLDPSTAATGRNSRNNRSRKLDSMLRNDSLSSDPSDCARPPPPKPHKQRRGKPPRQQSLSSSDDEIRSTPECSSGEEQDLESESIISEKGGEYLETDYSYLEIDYKYNKTCI